MHRSEAWLGRQRKRKKSRRKPGPRARVWRREHGPVPQGKPVHVTLRMWRDVPSLRNRHCLKAFRVILARGCERGAFRVVRYTVMDDYVHLIVEAEGKEALASRMKRIGGRMSLAMNQLGLGGAHTTPGTPLLKPIATPPRISRRPKLAALYSPLPPRCPLQAHSKWRE